MKDWAIRSERDMESEMQALNGLAYTTGFFLGDGCLTSYPFKSPKNGKTYHKNDVSFGKPDYEVIERVRDQIGEVFGKKYAIIHRKLPSGLPYYEMTAHRRDIFDFFAVNTKMKSEVPAHYHQAPEDARIELLCGLFDSDGHVSEFADGATKRWQVGFSNTKRGLVESVAAMMQRIGVKVGKISEMEKAGYRICYGVKPNARSFVECGLHFYSRRRQEKLDRYVSHVLGSETAYTGAATTV